MPGVPVTRSNPSSKLSSPLVGEDQGGGRPASAGQKTPESFVAAPTAGAAEAAPPPNPPHKGEGFKRLKLPADAIQRARRLRRDMTDAERVLWHALRETFPDLHWRHQVPFGRYTADFCSHRARLIVEADGGQHATEASQAYDAARTAFLAAEGYRILRFWNHEILANTDGALQTIADAVSSQRADA